MAQELLIESAIHQQLARAGTCSLDELAAQLPSYSWAQVFAAVDRLTREGTIALKRGLYHFNLLVDGNWVVPNGVATVPDGMGGMVAVLVVP